MTEQPTITIPRHDNESARAYATRIEYVTMGPQRSLDLVGKKSAKSVPLLKRWSVAHSWQDSARRYDEAMAHVAVQMAGEAYRKDLEQHRKDAQQYGRALCGVAIEMLTQLRAEARKIEYSPSALATIARALTVGMDLQAHALQVAELLPKLTDDIHDTE